MRVDDETARISSARMSSFLPYHLRQPGWVETAIDGSDMFIGMAGWLAAVSTCRANKKQVQMTLRQKMEKSGS